MISNEEIEGPILMTDRSIRLGFIRKVYTLLAIELLVFFGCCMIGGFLQPLRDWVHQHPMASFGMALGFMLSAFIPYFAIACYASVRTRVPVNYIVFNLFVVLMSAGGMIFTSMFRPYAVICALGTTFALVIALTLVSFIPCFDITGWGIYFWAFSIALMIYGMIASMLYLFLQLEILYLVYAGLAVVLTSVYIVFTTQLIIGGKKYEIGADEYILGTIMLFTHIITLFMNLLILFGR